MTPTSSGSLLPFIIAGIFVIVVLGCLAAAAIAWLLNTYTFPWLLPGTVISWQQSLGTLIALFFARIILMRPPKVPKG